MNCPSRTEEPPESDGMNQNPSSLSADLTTRNDLNGIANSRVLRESSSSSVQAIQVQESDEKTRHPKKGLLEKMGGEEVEVEVGVGGGHDGGRRGSSVDSSRERAGQGRGRGRGQAPQSLFMKVRKLALTFSKFIGPGFMISVAYIDPGNYATDVAAGATYKYKLLFIVLMSNLFAIFLQSLCIKLGSVSGLNLAESCRAFLPWWLNIFLYILAEGAIIATDIAEVIGTAIAINLLVPKIPLVAGCALSIADVLLILLFYKPSGSMRGLRAFEYFVMALVIGVVVCFCIQLSLIENTSIGEIFRGYLPSSAIVQSDGLYQACGILGATVMPHSLYLGSGIVQPRLREYDIKHGLAEPYIETNASDSESTHKDVYYPSLGAINFCLKYSVAELSIALFTFALFVNSAILITAGAALYGTGAADADLFGIYDLLSKSIAPAAGTVFALALLLSGISAGIVCTIAGQMVSEGALNWTIAPWMRRLITRSISITPSIIIAGAVGRKGLSAALNGSQVALSVSLPFISAPLIYFTCRNKYMTVGVHAPRNTGDREDVHEGREIQTKKMRNHWITATIGILIWLIITVMNVANLVLLGKGEGA